MRLRPTLKGPRTRLSWTTLVGTLEVGKKADLLVLSQDPFSVVPVMIAKTRVLTTIVGGRVVYDIAGPVPGDGVNGRKTKR